MRVVAVSQRVDTHRERDERRDALDQRLSVFLVSAGFLPVPIPNALFVNSPDGKCDPTVLDAWLAAVDPFAFVLSGGNDHGEHCERDSTESRLLDHASERQMPLLGICRGMQMMAHWNGAELVSVEGHTRNRHQLSGEIDREVNSYHAFSLASCPVDFRVLARSEDGEIEAIRHLSLPWEGWMWHPEREAGADYSDVRRLNALFVG